MADKKKQNCANPPPFSTITYNLLLTLTDYPLNKKKTNETLYLKYSVGNHHFDGTYV